jgi:prophage regulatory protein
VTASTQTIVILRQAKLLARIGLSRACVYDKLNPNSIRYDATFPKQIKLGPGAVGWIESEIDEWIRSRINASRHSK